MLNVAFCDDDNSFLYNIVPMAKKIFKKLKIDVSIYIFTNADTLIKSFEQYNPYYNIIFLDIDMPIDNGKEVARKLRLIDRKFKLVFITSFEQEALNTFQYDVSGFLPKLMLDEQLPSVIERIVKAINEENPQIQVFKIYIKDNRISTIKVPLNYIFVISNMISGNLLSLIYKTNIENIISIELSLFVFSKIIDFVLVLLCILFFKKIYFSISTKYLISIDLIIGFFIVIMILFMEVNGMLQNKNSDYSVQIVKISIKNHCVLAHPAVRLRKNTQ